MCYGVIQITAMDESYLKSLAEYIDRGNDQEVFVNALSKIFTDVKLGGVRSCLAIGPGDGWRDIEFIKHCEANISKFIGVEPDHASAEYLRTSLRSSLPGVESQDVFETTMQTWEGPGIPVDLITMFHVLYRVTAGERHEFLKKVHDSWLVSGGYVAVLTASRTTSPKSAGIRIFENLGHTTPAWEDIEADFLKAGFTKHYEHEIHHRKDFTGPTENNLPFYQPYFKDRIITLAEVREAVKGVVITEGKMDEFQMMAIFKSTN